MTKWIVEIEGVRSPEFLGEVIQSLGYSLSKDGYWRLSHPKYSDDTDASKVYEDANHLDKQLRALAELEGQNLGFSVVGVQQSQDFDTIQRYVFATAKWMDAPHAFRATGHSQLNPNLTEEERAKRMTEAAQTRIEVDRKKKELEQRALIRRLGIALQYPLYRQVLELVKKPNLSATECGHILDLVEEDLSGDLSDYTSDKQRKRFFHSINHPKVMGLDARHAVSNKQPPKKPMNLDEARSFAIRIGKTWLSEQENRHTDGH